MSTSDLVTVVTNAQAREEVDVLTAIFHRVTEGQPASKACDAEGFNLRTFWRRLAADKAVFDAYESALRARAHVFAEEITELSDERPPMVGDTNHQAGDAASPDGNTRMDSAFVAWKKLQVDSRKWVISKLLPKKYADKLDLTHAGADGGPIQITRIERVIVRPPD